MASTTYVSRLTWRSSRSFSWKISGHWGGFGYRNLRRHNDMTVKQPQPNDLEPIETASVDELQALQLTRLKNSLNHAYNHSALYAQKFDAARDPPNDLSELEDLSQFPFTDKADLRNFYPFETFATPMADVVVFTPRAEPRASQLSSAIPKTISTLVNGYGTVIRAAGGRANDLIHVSYGYGLFTGGLGAHYGAQKLGAAVIPMSGGQTEKQIQLINDFWPSIIMVHRLTA
ncbi:MAG: hypothetical protein Ct9H300mP14_05330 [Gammaproteobacteria bacterium]|nr:MAG: hypothetical protein Ct9H300mP14_05330 [Gammaproteobacteria bacterium]